MPGVLERRGEDVDLRWWRGARCLGKRERRWRGLGMEDGYGRRGETGGGCGHGAAGARLVASGGAGVVVVGARGGGWVWAAGGNREPGGACGGRGRWTRGGGGVPGGVGGSGSGGGGGWGWGSCMAGGGRGRWTWGGSGARGGARGSGSGGSGVLGGRGGTWGSGSGVSGWLRRGGGVGSVGAFGECVVRGGSGSAAVCGTGPHRSSQASLEASAGPGGLRVVPPGTEGGGGFSRRPWIRHVGVWRRQRQVVWVERLSLAGVGPGGPFGVGVVARGDTDTVPGTGGVAGTGGWPLAVGGVCGWSARWCHPIRWCCSFTGGCGPVG